MPDTESQTFDAEPESVRRARAHVASVLAGWGIDPSADLALMTSEAVTNAVLHADSASVSLQVCRREGRLCVTVHDDDPTLPIQRDADPLRLGGHGMAIIDAVSERWGVDEVPGDGKDLWFCVQLPGATAGRMPTEEPPLPA